MPQLSTNIYPSLLAADMSCLKDEMMILEKFPIAGFHWDVMDHHFVPNLSFGMGLIRSCRRHSDLPFHVHLMVDNPEKYFPDCQSIGVDCIYIHAEQRESVLANLQHLQNLNIKAGLVINPETSFADVSDLVTYADAILFMTVSPGFSGQSFQTPLLSKLSEFTNAPLLSGKTIMVDGGMNAESLSQCYHRGVRHFVVGNSLMQGQHLANREQEILSRWDHLLSQVHPLQENRD